VTEIVTELSTDVIALHEVSPEQAEQITEMMTARYPYHVLSPDDSDRGLLLLSRHPIKEHDFFRPLPQSDSDLRAVIDVDGIPVTLYVAHLQSPRGGITPFSYDTSIRNAEMADLRDRIQVETGPMLLLCDCNMSDLSDPYRALDELLDDAFREAGQGLGFTFRYRKFLPFMVRIDYIWYSDHFAALDARAWNDAGPSDHRPVIATLSLKQERPPGE
jgi:vancomycin resistance protein VanJ